MMRKAVVLKCFVGTAESVEDFIAERRIQSKNIHSVLFIGHTGGMELMYSLWYRAYLE